MIFVLAAGSMTGLERTKFEKIYERYASFIYRVALKELSEPDLAQDCAQAAFERVIKYIDRLGDPDSPQTKSYIYKITISVAANLRKHEERYVTKQDDELFYLVDRRNGHDSVSVNAELSEVLEFAEKNLSSEEKILLTCRLSGRNAYREAAEILGISEAACRKKMQRIRQKITDAFGTDFKGKGR